MRMMLYLEYKGSLTVRCDDHPVLNYILSGALLRYYVMTDFVILAYKIKCVTLD